MPRRRPRWARPAVVGAGVTLAHYLPSVCVLGQWSPSWVRALPAGLCRWRGPARARAVALTFDDGPSPDTTPRTLDLLDELGMRATFFVLGTQARAHPELVAEIVRRGHGVGSHGFSHEHHLLRSPRWIRDDLARAVEALDACGVRTRWFRPPYGQLTARTVLEARRQGMEVVLWSAFGHEWAEPDAESVMAHLAPRLEPGAIVVLHDTEVDAPAGTARRTQGALELLGPVLDDLELAAVSLEELLSGPRPPRAGRP
ncbi:MAG: polysaccharide deacetylase family protein [Acidobacteriota bacterium]|nr:polysaccharide deacetylase family protein [Acidobacteriota bacterium]